VFNFLRQFDLAVFARIKQLAAATRDNSLLRPWIIKYILKSMLRLSQSPFQMTSLYFARIRLGSSRRSQLCISLGFPPCKKNTQKVPGRTCGKSANYRDELILRNFQLRNLLSLTYLDADLLA
jgi:hypothetical protein